MKVRGEFGVCLADPREVVIGHKQDQPQERSDMISKTARPCTVVLAALLYATTAFAQENRGTSEQRAACAVDAFLLCGSYIPHSEMVESCMRRKKSDLSDACRSVFEQSAGQQEQVNESRRYRE